MNWGHWALWGFAATVVLTTIMAAAQGLRWTRMSLPYLVGSFFVAGRDQAKAVGFAAHLVNGWVFSLIYVAAFESLHRATWWLGAIIGFIHATFVLTVGASLMPGLHPRMASEQQGPTVTRQLEPPGFLGLNYGVSTPVFVVLAHIAFGAVLGGFYVV